MPHFFIEYSSNIEQEIEVERLMTLVRDTAVASSLFDPYAIRVRALRRDKYLLADGNPNYGFVHVTARIQAGRDDATKKALGEKFLNAVNLYLEPVFKRHPLALNIEIQEVSPFSFRRRTIGASS